MKTSRSKITGIPCSVRLSPQEEDLVTHLALKLRCTRSQVFRWALAFYSYQATPEVLPPDLVEECRKVFYGLDMARPRTIHVTFPGPGAGALVDVLA